MNLIPLVTTLIFALADSVTYVGDWTSSMNDATGTMKIAIATPGKSPEASPTCEFSFAIADGTPVKGETLACKMDAEKIQWEYKWESQGYKMRTTMQGKMTNDSASGTYETFTPDDAKFDSGTWKVKQK